MDASAVREAIVDTLSAAESPLREQGAELLVSHILTQPLGAVLRPAEVAPIVAKLATAEQVRLFQERYGDAINARALERLQKSQVRLEDLLSADTRQELEKIVQQFRPGKGKWAKGAVDPKDVRALFAPVVQQALIQFAGKLSVFKRGGGTPPAAASAASRGIGRLAGRLKQRVEARAEKIVDVGRRLGAEVDKKLQQSAKEFSQTVMEGFREAMKARLTSDEGQELLKKIKSDALERITTTPLADIVGDVRDEDRERIEAWVPSVVADVAASEFFAQALEDELAAVMEESGQRAVGDLLAEWGVQAEVRASLLATVEPLLQSWAASAGFAQWMDQLLAHASEGASLCSVPVPLPPLPMKPMASEAAAYS